MHELGRRAFLQSSVALAGAALAPTAVHAQQGRHLFANYVGYDAGNMPASQIPWSLGITHLSHFAAMPRVSGGASQINMAHFSPPLDPGAVRASRSAAGSSAKLLLSVGGANSNSAFVAAINNNRQQLINDIVAKVAANGYDGVDVDWEIPALAVAVDRQRFIQSLTALHDALVARNSRYILTTGSTLNYGPANKAEQLFADLVRAGKLQKLLVQTYHLSVPVIALEQKAWHNSAALSSSDHGNASGQFSQNSVGLKYVTIPNPDLARLWICLGCQFGGKRWFGGLIPVTGHGVRKPLESWANGGTRPSLDTSGGAEKLYRDIIRRADFTPNNRRRDIASGQTPYLSVTGATPAADSFLSYDDATSMREKGRLIRANGWGGAMVWHLGGGYVSSASTVAGKHPLLAALADGLFG